MLLQRQDREAVTALPDWSVWNFSSRENPAPHHIGRPPHIGRAAALIRENVLAAELNSFPLLGQLRANPWTILDHAPAALCLWRRDAISHAEASVDQCPVTIEVDPVPSQCERFAAPDSG